MTTITTELANMVARMSAWVARIQAVTVPPGVVAQEAAELLAGFEQSLAAVEQRVAVQVGALVAGGDVTAPATSKRAEARGRRRRALAAYQAKLRKKR